MVALLLAVSAGCEEGLPEPDAGQDAGLVDAADAAVGPDAAPTDAEPGDATPMDAEPPPDAGFSPPATEAVVGAARMRGPTYRMEAQLGHPIEQRRTRSSTLGATLDPNTVVKP